MEFKHKDLLNEFNRQVQSGEYEKVGGNGSIVILQEIGLRMLDSKLGFFL